jgi:cytosine/creatinine deaminase
MSWFTPPTDAHYILHNVSLPGAGTRRFAVEIDHRSVKQFSEPGVTAAQPTAAQVCDARGGLLLPAFVDLHVHLDKGLIHARTGSPEGDLFAGIAASAQDRDRWTPEELFHRMDFSLRCAYAHGTRALRTHIDFTTVEAPPAWDVAEVLAAQWADRITLQRVALTPLDLYEDGGVGARIAAKVARTGGVLGAFVYRNDNLVKKLEKLFALAASYDLDLDFHVDEGLDAEATGLREIAGMTPRFSMQGRVVCGHCCSLIAQPLEQAQATLKIVKEAGVTIVTLPTTNVFLQGRRGETPSARGLTRIHEARAEEVLVALGSDNHRDAFYPYGDLDLWSAFTLGTQLAHLKQPVADWLDLITGVPAYMMGLPNVSPVQIGSPADFVLLNARNDSEALARPQHDRVVIRNGQCIDTTLPDYRELDELFRSH